MRQQPSLNKLTRPLLPAVYPRQRLFRLLDHGRAPVVWITGPPGSGKTTLAASWLDSRKLPCLWYQADEGDGDIGAFFYYLGLAARRAAPRIKRPLPLLTPEYQLDVPTFTRRYCEDLFSRLKPPFILVLDNYQDVPAASPLHGVLQVGLSRLPPGFRALVISRSDPPPVFARMLANKEIDILGWDELRLTPEESAAVLKLQRGDRSIPREALHDVQEKAQGWAAGVVLLEVARRRGGEHAAPGAMLPGKLSDYFAGEVFEKLDEERRLFLLKTAFLPRMTPRMAESLSNTGHAARILSDLHQRNYFTEKRFHPEVTYQYHALFREFLLGRGEQVFPPTTREHLQLHAARLLEAAGAVEDAAELYRRAGVWEELAHVVRTQACSLIRQGRLQTLEQWLANLPEEARSGDPWLLYWQGVCVQSQDLPAARGFFERALNLFENRKDILGVLQVWSDIVDTYFYEWNDFRPLDRWIRWLDGRIRSGITSAPPEIVARVAMSMTAALMIRQPQYPDIGRWLEWSVSFARRCGDPNLLMQACARAANYYLWIGDQERARTVMEEIHAAAQSAEASPLALLTWRWMEAGLQILSSASPRSALPMIMEALAFADKMGVHVWDHMLYALGVNVSLLAGDLEGAAAFLRKMERLLHHARLHGYCHYHYLCAWHALASGKPQQAGAAVEKAHALAEQTGYVFPAILCRLEAAVVFHELGQVRAAAAHLTAASKQALQTNNAMLQYMALLIKGYFALQEGRNKAGWDLLRKALAIGRERGYVTPLWWWDPGMMGRLCAEALEAGIEADYAKQLIRVHSLLPGAGMRGSEAWPWPVKVFTLGRFELHRDGVPVSFSGKVQKKPLEMLKAVLAFGGSGVGQDQMIDALWPETEGDTGYTLFKTTLHRLRQLLGNEEAMALHEGRLSLDRQRCWADAWAFEKVLEEALRNGESGMRNEKNRKSKSPSGINVALLEKAVGMYKGHFLADDAGKPWTVSLRERLKARFIQAISSLGGFWVSQAEAHRSIRRRSRVDLETALFWYQKGLEIDDLAEEFYQRLMTCHLTLGRKAEALKAYDRCRATLAAVLGIEPSEETTALHRSIKQC